MVNANAGIPWGKAFLVFKTKIKALPTAPMRMSREIKKKKKIKLIRLEKKKTNNHNQNNKESENNFSCFLQVRNTAGIKILKNP